MKVKLIADAGSTKIEWLLIDADGTVGQSVITTGINALLSSVDQINIFFSEICFPNFSGYNVEEIYYYGAGCATPAICSNVSKSLSRLWSGAECHVHSDMVGAARALFKDRRGIACILGTGSNSCLYDGEKVVSSIPSLGYVLGDEGSGAVLGKRLLSDVFKGQLPISITDAFFEEYGLTKEIILNKVYRESSPNRFLASFVPFLSRNIEHPAIHSLVLGEFSNFFQRNVAQYDDAHLTPISFIGSVAYIFRKSLFEAASVLGFDVADVERSPMSGLIDYHLKDCMP